MEVLVEVLVEVQAEPSEESGALFLGPSPEWMKKNKAILKALRLRASASNFRLGSWV